MFTSYFSKYKEGNGISIARITPHWFKGKEYKKLAPSYWLLNKYKNDGDIEFFTKYYQENVLDLLDPTLIYQELGEDAVLLCWEKSDKFCHRHLVAKWLNEKLNLNIKEHI